MPPWFKPTAQGGGFSLITDGLVSRYTFEDDSTPSTLTDTVGTSDMTNTGMTYGSSSSGRPTGATGAGYGDYDGVDDESRLQRSLPNTTAWTFVTWVYTRSATDFIVLWGQITDGQSISKTGVSFNGSGEIRATTKLNGNFTKAIGPSIQTGEWALAAAIWDGNTELRIRYADSRGEFTNATSTSEPNTADLTDFIIGKGTGTNSDTHDGRIDDARHYNLTLIHL